MPDPILRDRGEGDSVEMVRQQFGPQQRLAQRMRRGIFLNLRGDDRDPEAGAALCRFAALRARSRFPRHVRRARREMRGSRLRMADNPFFRFFRHVSFPLERRQWDRMPRHPAFKHEYWDGELHWTPRPDSCDCHLDLAAWQPPPRGERSLPREEVAGRPLREEDWKALPRVFRAAFGQWPPLSQWEGAAPLRASRCILEWARLGRDGPLVPEACVVALMKDDRAEEDAERIAGAAIVTMIETKRLRGAPSEADERMPHLDWLFVPWMDQRRGIATRLLTSVVEALRALGHRTLASTVLTANPPSMLWHWRCGFTLRGD